MLKQLVGIGFLLDHNGGDAPGKVHLPPNHGVGGAADDGALWPVF